MNTTTIKMNLSKKAKAHLSSLILSSHCGMILINNSEEKYKRTGDLEAHEKTTRIGFKMHDRAIIELNEILGSNLARYKYQTREDLDNMD